MTVYDKPFVYTLSHILLGAAAPFYPIIVFLFLLYQLVQLFLNVRIFGFSFDYKVGNNWFHTLQKFAEFIAGASISLLFFYK